MKLLLIIVGVKMLMCQIHHAIIMVYSIVYMHTVIIAVSLRRKPLYVHKLLSLEKRSWYFPPLILPSIR